MYGYLLKNNIYSRKYFYPIMTEFGCYKDKYIGVNLPVAREVGRKILCLPLYNGLSQETIIKICKIIREFK